MAIKLDYELARVVLAQAVQIATDRRGLPVEWVSHARTVFGLDSKTYTPALATLLLAKAVNENVDTLSIKVTGENSYSLRGLGHGVVVPGAVTFGFSLRTTGHEPLNNQPWFRYNRIDEFERVKVRKDYEYFLEVAKRADLLSENQALLALAAFVRVALEEAAKVKAVVLKATGLTSESVRIAAEDFLRSDATDRPQRLQAFAAACLDLSHADVRSRRINDPSRDFPGDVHAYVGDKPILALEVRGKPVSITEFASFADACEAAGVRRAMLFVDSPQHRPIELESLSSYALSSGAVQATLFESVAVLSEAALAWADLSLTEATTRLTGAVLERLRQIEVTKPTLDEWVRAVTVAKAR